ncbi:MULTISPECIES: TlpA family protein disulfide reductase [unclassified Leifsonia]|uniref:TlpA family protein disulfide reductase n=1 Tax=unclassified Leifsonia TaxID=2663824 RepID=UPI0006FC1ECC|nr:MULTISPECIES: TlpA disulfide reductase family protein [unclassified Leifsonia]KQX05332.1 alkyl hydroperoxide reductase [Leifsonia sp. Root1293]KRA08964.1 alkyl hydroperoxide reductase [Leifsonia sp. Root60]
MRARLSPRLRASVAIGIAFAAVVSLGACTSDPLADQYRAGSGKNYVAGDGTVTEIDVDDRGEAIDFSGTTQDGEAFDSTEHAGDVLVVNFWYAGCAPCRAEAADLESINQEFGDDGATFIGVNVRDQSAQAQAFDEKYGVTYPSIMDLESGAVQLAFAGKVPANAVPTTLVLDKQGRVAARILGQLQSPSILETLVRDTLAESD